MLKKILFLLSSCLLFSIPTTLAQKPDEESEKTRPQEVKPVEVPSKPANETKASDNSSKSENSSKNNSNSNGNSSSREESNSRREKPPRDPNSGERPPNRERDPNRRKDPDNDEVKRPRRPERPPVEKPNTPPVENPNPNPPPVENNPNQGRKNDRDKDKDKDKDDKDRDDKKRNRNRGVWGGNNYPYPTSVPFPSTPPTFPPTFSLKDYFDKDDVFFDTYNVYVDTVSGNYLPFFEDSPRESFAPLYYSYGRKFFRNEFPFVADDWTIYYEPDLDDIFVDFAMLRPEKYERMVMYPIGETIKKVAKKFNYKGTDLRPVLVEKVPEIEQDRIYSFNVHDLPKGDYELRFIAKNGSTVKHSIRLK